MNEIISGNYVVMSVVCVYFIIVTKLEVIADGIADSIYTLFCTYDDLNSQYLARLLLKPF